MERYKAYKDSGGRCFVYDNKNQCHCGRYKNMTIARNEAKEMNKLVK